MAGTGIGRGVLVGMVVTPDGWPVPHAMVTVVDETGGQTGRSAAGHDGRFTVEGLHPGTYTVITAAAGHAPQARTRLVNGAGPVDLGRLVLSRVSGTAVPTPGTGTSIRSTPPWQLPRCTSASPRSTAASGTSPAP